MKKILIIAISLVQILLTSCGHTQINALPASDPLNEPKNIFMLGPYVSEASKFEFPLKVGSFNRVSITQYDTASLHTSVGYNGGSASCPVTLTIYLSPTPRMNSFGASSSIVESLDKQWLEAYFNSSEQGIKDAHPSTSRVAIEKISYDKALGMRATYMFESSLSSLYVFVLNHQWFVKYRHTYPSICAQAAQESLGEFYSQWQWPAS